MTAKVELLPCPFCGSTDALRLQNTHTASFWVSCCEDDGGCGAQATGQFFPGPNRRTRFVYNPEAPEGSTFEARTLGELPPEYRRAAKSAIAAWNRRANVAHATASKEAEIERLRAEVREAREFRDKMANAIGNDQLRRFIEKHGEPVPLTIRMQQAEARAERLAEALRKLEEREQRYEALLRQALEALELRCGTHADERKKLIPALRERLGEGGAMIYAKETGNE